jgi:hypothetical protein
MPPPQSSSEAPAPGVTLQPDLGAERDSPARKRRLLIVSRNLASLRGHYEDVIVALAHAGVRVSIRYWNDKGLAADQYRETSLRTGLRCCAASNPVASEAIPGDLLALQLRQLASLLRFYHPDFGERGARRARVVKAAAGAAAIPKRSVRLTGAQASTTGSRATPRQAEPTSARRPESTRSTRSSSTSPRAARPRSPRPTSSWAGWTRFDRAEIPILQTAAVFVRPHPTNVQL